MRRVDIAFEALEPVGFALEQGDGQILFRNEQRLVHRQRRRFGPRAHVNPDQAGLFAHPIAFCANLFLEILRRGDVRHFEAVAIHVELPAVIDAADAVLLVTAEEQRGAAVRASVIHHANPAGGVAKRDELPLRAASAASDRRRAVSSEEAAAGIQYCRIISPMTVPGPTRVRSWPSVALDVMALDSALDISHPPSFVLQCSAFVAPRSFLRICIMQVILSSRQ